MAEWSPELGPSGGDTLTDHRHPWTYVGGLRSETLIFHVRGTLGEWGVRAYGRHVGGS